VQIPTEAWRAAVQPTSHVEVRGARDQQQGWDSWDIDGGTARRDRRGDAPAF